MWLYQLQGPPLGLTFSSHCAYCSLCPAPGLSCRQESAARLEVHIETCVKLHVAQTSDPRLEKITVSVCISQLSFAEPNNLKGGNFYFGLKFS